MIKLIENTMPVLNAIKWGMTMSLTIEIGYSKED